MVWTDSHACSLSLAFFFCKNIQMGDMNVLSQRSSQLKQRSLMFRPTCLVFLSSSVPLVSSPRHFCCLFLRFSSSLCVPCVLYPPLLLLALFLTAVPSAECLRCALWQCSLCISDSWVHAFHIFGIFWDPPKLRES